MAVYNTEKLVAVFNTYVFKKSILRFFIPPPFSPDCALYIAKGIDEKRVKALVEEWLQKESKKSYAQFQFSLSYKQQHLFEQSKPSGLNRKLRHTYVLDLTKAEDVQSLYAPKRRQQIRRALKDGLQVKQLDDLGILFRLVCQTFARQGKTIDEKMIKKVLFDYGSPEQKNSFAFGAFSGDECILAYFCIYHGKEAFYLLGGYDEANKHIGAGPLAMNACIEHAKKTGVEVFDFEGSMEPSIEKYFKQFGGEKKQYLSFERKNVLGKAATGIRKMLKG
ncbi:MAG: hypothetical protein K0S33_846 [Bacteroidetes bacterium]|jgi:lipid II:glycine glycyltransferase (peptidoglycan interpeptide bridge formation enzyme)|nr:hypothetical protein [Bacteroidota bacterium]